jgi:prevent-host-death family protein
MIVFSMTDARQNFTEIANQVVYGGDRIYVKKNGKPAFAMVSIADAELIEAIEDRIDLKDALEALKEPDTISLSQLRKELGI